MEQRTEDWFQARCGKVTASRIADVTAKTKTGWGAARKNYMGQLIAEILSGQPANGFSNAAMQWGTETEPQARDWHEFVANVDVVEVGFIEHPKIKKSGASPDGLIGDDGLVEIKCPNTATHIETLLTEKIDSKYMKQMFWQMACTRRRWCDFVSYDPRMPEDMSYWCKRIEWDEAVISDLENEVQAFIRELNAKVTQLTSKYRTAA